VKTVLIAAQISPTFDAYLQSRYTCNHDFQSTEAQRLATGIVTSTKLHIDAAFIDRCASLKWICRLGSGMEIIDSEYAAHKGIMCFSSPNGIANAVAEHVLAMLLTQNRNVLRAAVQVRQGLWIREPNRGQELAEHTVGIIGYGPTGQATAQKLQSFVNQILVFDKYKQVSDKGIVSQATLQEIYDHATIVSYHVPLTADTVGYYKGHHFKQVHQLVNTSRGAVACTADILKSFASGKLHSACIDVLDFEHEFPSLTAQSQQQLSTLLQQNCIITPHIAGYSIDAIDAMSKELQLQLQSLDF
jgi:D-3-phosphoglycerate dehydrogenase / 2-oxoglutarate reductase